MKKFLAIALALLFLSLLPEVFSAYLWGSNIYGLITVSTLEKEEDSFNPYWGKNDSGFLTSDMAMWILLNFDYPYESCQEKYIFPDCNLSPITWAGRSLGVGSKYKDERAMRLIRHFIERKLPVNAIYEGKAPIHESVMFDLPEFLEVLLENGANPYQEIEQVGKPYAGMNVFEFHEYSKKTFKGNRVKVTEILARYKRPSNGN